MPSANQQNMMDDEYKGERKDRRFGPQILSAQFKHGAEELPRTNELRRNEAKVYYDKPNTWDGTNSKGELNASICRGMTSPRAHSNDHNIDVSSVIRDEGPTYPSVLDHVKPPPFPYPMLR